MNSVVSPIEQAVEFLKEARRPLVLVHHAATLDVLAAGQALARALTADHPGTTLVVLPSTPPANAEAVPSLVNAVDRVPPARDFVISVDTRRVQVDSLSYDVQPGRLEIHLMPKAGTFQSTDVATPTSQFFFDHLVTINVNQLSDLGPEVEQQRDFFYHTPTLNLDCRPSNKRFGHVNLVDLTTSGVSEIVAELLHALQAGKIESTVAETLLTGIISVTNGFQGDQVNPRTLMAASRLMTAGAKREEIVRRLYQTKTVPQLRLWGRALANLQSADRDQLIWVSIRDQDLKQAGVQPQHVSGLAHELLSSAPAASFACVFLETPPSIAVTVIQRPDAPQPILPDNLTPSGPHQFTGQMSGALNAVEQQIIGSLRASLN